LSQAFSNLFTNINQTLHQLKKLRKLLNPWNQKVGFVMLRYPPSC
jgi:hypothetical protein